MKNKNSYLNLFLSFVRVGVLTFGGGVAMLPMLQRECVDKNGWATEEEMLNYYAIGQCTPGIIAVNTGTFIGFKIKGVAGAFVATLGVILPSFLIISALAFTLSAINENIYFIKAMRGVRIVVCALIANAVFNMSKKNLKDMLSVFVALVSFALSLFAKLSPMYTVILVALFALFYFFILGRRDKAI